jgi:hypothetical protein
MKFFSFLALFLILLSPCVEAADKVSKTIAAVLREPLPAENLSLSDNAGEWVIAGPTFAYRVQKNTGAISLLRVDDVIGASRPLDIQIDDYHLASESTSGEFSIVTQGGDKIVLRGHGILRDPAKLGPEVDYTLLHTFYNDGVVVSSVTLTPCRDLPVKSGLFFKLQAQGQFSHYLHKRRDENGANSIRDRLPDAGKTVRFSTLSSCLEVFSSQAALALFTDCGATFLSKSNLDTASVKVMSQENKQAEIGLCQYLIHIAPDDKPYVLKAGEPFTFRVGMSVSPNRSAPARLHDLRMFAWIGDAKYPYATDQEIEEVARAGYTVFQMHRLGTPGEPRPPAGELERVIKKVHESGMLFLWTENADQRPGCPGDEDKRPVAAVAGIHPGRESLPCDDGSLLRHAINLPGFAERAGRIPAGDHQPDDGTVRRGWDLSR